jgi:hypothetical protein
MTPDDFRRIALSMPEAVEASHMGHPDFRVAGKIFATLGWPDTMRAMVKLTADQQAMLTTTMPKVFSAVPGGWGRRGSTHVHLAAADETALASALAMAWGNIAPKSLVARARTTKVGRPGTTSKRASPHPDRGFARIRAAAKAAKLPAIAEGTSYGTPALKVRGKLLMRMKDADTLVFHCPIEEKAMLLEAASEIYFETDHYKGWPAVLVRASKASDAELEVCLQRAWRSQAPAKLRAQFEGPASGKPQRRRAE